VKAAARERASEGEGRGGEGRGGGEDSRARRGGEREEEGGEEERRREEAIHLSYTHDASISPHLSPPLPISHAPLTQPRGQLSQLLRLERAAQVRRHCREGGRGSRSLFSHERCLSGGGGGGTVAERLWRGCGEVVERLWGGCGEVVERLWRGLGKGR